MDRVSSVGIATGYGLDDRGIESRWGRDFPYPSRPTLGPTQPPIQWVPGLSRGTVTVAWCWPPTPYNAEVEERVDLYICSPTGHSWPFLGWTLFLPFTSYKISCSLHPCVLVKVIPFYVMKACWGVDVQLHSFLTSTLYDFTWSTSQSSPCTLHPLNTRQCGSHNVYVHFVDKHISCFCTTNSLHQNQWADFLPCFTSAV